jgi:hypothetical protein
MKEKKKKKVRDLYRGISDFKKGYQLRNNIVKDEKCDSFADYPSVLVDRGTIYLRYSMYIELVMLGRQQYTHQNR